MTFRPNNEGTFDTGRQVRIEENYDCWSLFYLLPCQQTKHPPPTRIRAPSDRCSLHRKTMPRQRPASDHLCASLHEAASNRAIGTNLTYEINYTANCGEHKMHERPVRSCRPDRSIQCALTRGAVFTCSDVGLTDAVDSLRRFRRMYTILPKGASGLTQDSSDLVLDDL
jgi:hypothetical protein